MSNLLLDPEYSVNTGPCYFIDEPSLREDWLIYMLFFDVIYTLTGPSDEVLQESILTIKQYPLEKLFNNYKFTDEPPTNPQEIELRLVQLCLDNDMYFLSNPLLVDREELISRIGAIIPASIPLLKDSFLRFDILRRVVLPLLPSVSGVISKELVSSIEKFKNSNFRESIDKGVDILASKYSGNYEINAQIEAEIQNWLIEHQREFLELVDFDKIKSFDFKSLVEDGIGTIGGLLTPFLPLGTIIETYNYLKNRKKLKNDAELFFVFALMYLQKTMGSLFTQSYKVNQCPICKITKVEINGINNDEVDEFVFEKIKGMCHEHLFAYLHVRKFARLTGKDLLIAIKDINKS
ncbi:MAG TPA: hypothetical protein VK169_10610 [Saprospiraceae bacterium]|nr:hypothetical protein [Saprospiraceae bacterium]